MREFDCVKNQFSHAAAVRIKVREFGNEKYLDTFAHGIPEDDWQVLETGYSSMHPGHCEFQIYYYAKHSDRKCWVVKSCGLKSGASDETFDGDDIDKEGYTVIAVCHEVPEDEFEKIGELIYEMLWDEGFGFD